MIFTNLNRLIVDNYSADIEEALSFFCANKTKFTIISNNNFIINNTSSVTTYNYHHINNASFLWHSHRKTIDIYIILQGKAIMEIADIDYLIPSKKYQNKIDTIFYNGDAQSLLKLYKNDILICYPEDAHHLLRDYISFDIKLCIFKIKIH